MRYKTLISRTNSDVIPLSVLMGVECSETFASEEATEMIRFRQLRCSFCGKKDSEVSKLVAGPHVYICDACVAIATQLMNDPPSDDHPPTAQSSVWQKFVSQFGHFIRGRHALRVGSDPISS